MGSQIPCEQLLKTALERKADAILVSQIVTQKNIHVQNLTKLIELLEAEGVRERFVLIVGGPRINNAFAKELGYDAGFGPRTTPARGGLVPGPGGGAAGTGAGLKPAAPVYRQASMRRPQTRRMRVRRTAAHDARAEEDSSVRQRHRHPFRGTDRPGPVPGRLRRHPGRRTSARSS